MRRYNVRRRSLVDFILEALEESGARIINAPDPNSAPFELGIETPRGELLKLICYGFTANKYRQGGRPADEHRFQVKYGGDLSGYHLIYAPTDPQEVTLFFGAHLEEEIFVACDPAMHRMTRFSSSVEFKTEHVERAQREGWYGWERDRSHARRKRPAPNEDFRVEALLAFTPKNFLRYVSFERIATGLDPGERLLLLDRMREKRPRSLAALRHPLEVELGISAEKILDIIGGAFRLRAAVRGSAAEYQLGQLLERTPGITTVRKLDKDAQPDFEVVYKRRRPVLIECKNTLRGKVGGAPKVDFQKTRAAKGNPCSRYYLRSQFHVLAACLHPITESWDFQFCRTADLASHKTCEGRLSPNVRVSGDGWTSSVEQILEEFA